MSRVGDDEIETVEGIPVTSASRTLLDLASVLSPGQLERALNEAEVRRLTSRRSIPELMRRHPRRAGAATLRRLLEEGAATRGVTKRELEARFADFVRKHGLPAPRRNAQIEVGGRFFEVDCLWPRRRLIVELDSRGFHDTDRAFERDRERDRILLADGYRTTRVTWRALHAEPREVLADLRRTLGL
jgi:very-short-patch-repair endonuclease